MKEMASQNTLSASMLSIASHLLGKNAKIAISTTSERNNDNNWSVRRLVLWVNSFATNQQSKRFMHFARSKKSKLTLENETRLKPARIIAFKCANIMPRGNHKTELARNSNYSRKDIKPSPLPRPPLKGELCRREAPIRHQSVLEVLRGWQW